jgi:hypothetical protein
MKKKTYFLQLNIFLHSTSIVFKNVRRPFKENFGMVCPKIYRCLQNPYPNPYPNPKKNFEDPNPKKSFRIRNTVRIWIRCLTSGFVTLILSYLKQSKRFLLIN